MAIVYYILDTETTGLKYDFHDLVEISVIRYPDALQLTKQVKALKPENANFDSLQIIKKSMKDLYQGMNRADMVDEYQSFFAMDGLTRAHRCIVAHNAPFDRKFVHHVWAKHGKIFPADLWLDTLTLSRRIAKDKGINKTADGKNQSFRLYDTCDLFGVKKTGSPHNAQDDTRNTFLLFKHFVDNNIDFLDMIKRMPHDEE